MAQGKIPPNSPPFELRYRAAKEGISLDGPDDSDDQIFQFDLGDAVITTLRASGQVSKLVALAKDLSGEGQGLHAALLGLRASGRQLDEEGRKIVIWRPVVRGSNVVLLKDWLSRST